jgi:hypothetical protein
MAASGAPPTGGTRAAGRLHQGPGKNKASPLHLAGEASPLAVPLRAAVAEVTVAPAADARKRRSCATKLRGSGSV